jgi:hypothetical protein
MDYTAFRRCRAIGIVVCSSSLMVRAGLGGWCSTVNLMAEQLGDGAPLLYEQQEKASVVLAVVIVREAVLALGVVQVVEAATGSEVVCLRIAAHGMAKC